MKLKRCVPYLMLLAVIVGFGGVLLPLWTADEVTVQNWKAARALSRQEWSTARTLAESVLRAQPENTHALTAAGVACTRMHDNMAAVKYLEQFQSLGSTDQPQLLLTVLLELGNRSRQLGQLRNAEMYFREALALDSKSLVAHRQLHHLLGFQGRCAEAAPHLLAIVQSGQFRADELFVLGIPERITIADEQLREHCENHKPDDLLRRLGDARIMVTDHDLNRAEPILRNILEHDAELPLASALLGELLLEQNRIDEYHAWHQSLSDTVANSPEVWFVRSLRARGLGQKAAAVRCLLETLKSYPSHVRANYQLSQLFQSLGEPERALFFSERSKLLSTLDYVINDLRSNPDERLMRQAIAALEKLGRGWEATAWCHLAKDWGGEEWAPVKFLQLTELFASEPDVIASSSHPLNDIDVAAYPVPDWTEAAFLTAPEVPQNSRPVAEIRFVDMAAETGLEFQYFNSMNPAVGLEHIFQTTGGGAAALDFDLDLWPDLYFGNGKELPEQLEGFNAPQSEHRNALFRNMAGQGFLSVGRLAGVEDDRFSQGIAAGDIDNDGFPDLYVANVGQNRLYRNNGDGTFTEVSQESNVAGNDWTMSAMIADVDGDGLSDIYAVNYLDMEQVFTRSCKKDGQPLTCAPTLFDAAQDRIYRNLGDGTFEDATAAMGITHPNGKGLGIVGLHVEGLTGLQLFVANDTTENQYFERISAAGEPCRYADRAMLAGLAMNESGNIQACMGVAAGDANLDGRQDLFVTNFYADSNTLYLQSSPGMFTDVTRTAGMAEPSYQMLGFGTQFLDVDLDGDPDVIVTNGHVDQTFATGEPDRMPPQLFLNDGAGIFHEASRAAIGECFQELRLGRALLRLDWNRDHKNDVGVVHLDAPAALLTNQTVSESRSVAVYLRGTTDCRDAVGATVSLVTEQGVQTQQLTGGDGYQVTNEKKLIFGGYPADSSAEITVRWMNGEQASFLLKNSREIMIVQGGGVFLIPSK